MSASGLSAVRLRRLREVMTRHVESGDMPGLVALVARRGAVHVEAIGTLEAGGTEPMRRDTIFRIASVTKQIAAAAAMTLVEQCRLRLDDPVDDLLPELADRQVLTRIEAPLDDTVPAHRQITVRDLLTFVWGLGAIMAPPGQYPIQRAMKEAGLEPGPRSASAEPDEWMKRLGRLPLAYQPGDKWLYHTGSDVLGVLMARATGQPLAEVLAERVLRPLDMADTGFHVPETSLPRLAAAYRPDPETGALPGPGCSSASSIARWIGYCPGGAMNAPRPITNVSRSRRVIGRCAGTVSSSGASSRAKTWRSASSGSRSSTGSSSRSRHSSTRVMAVAAAICLVTDAIRKIVSRRIGAPPPPL